VIKHNIEVFYRIFWSTKDGLSHECDYNDVQNAKEELTKHPSSESHMEIKIKK